MSQKPAFPKSSGSFPAAVGRRASGDFRRNFPIAAAHQERLQRAREHAEQVAETVIAWLAVGNIEALDDAYENSIAEIAEIVLDPRAKEQTKEERSLAELSATESAGFIFSVAIGRRMSGAR